jgi:hypothetical protein
MVSKRPRQEEGKETSEKRNVLRQPKWPTHQYYVLLILYRSKTPKSEKVIVYRISSSSFYSSHSHEEYFLVVIRKPLWCHSVQAVSQEDSLPGSRSLLTSMRVPSMIVE